MFHIRLTKGRSYNGVVTATRNKPDVYIESEATVKAAVATGFFTLVEGEMSDKDSKPKAEEKAQGKTLDEMNKSELETFATYRNVDIKGLRSKADIIARLKEVLPAEDLDGVIEYGSPTMTELQKERA